MRHEVRKPTDQRNDQKLDGKLRRRKFRRDGLLVEAEVAPHLIGLRTRPERTMDDLAAQPMRREQGKEKRSTSSKGDNKPFHGTVSV